MTVRADTRVLMIALLFGLPTLVLADDKDSRDLNGFHAISVAEGINLEVHQGDHYAVKVHTDGGDTDEVETVVERETLVIRKDSGFFGFFNFGWIHWFEHYSVDVTLPKLESVVASGGSHVKFDGNFSGDELVLRASGGSNVRFKGKFDSLEVTTSGGSDASLEGAAHVLKGRASGGSDIHALDLDVSEAELVASGGADVVVTVHDKLTARASGGSAIRYEGHPKETDIKSSGGGRVKPR